MPFTGFRLWLAVAAMTLLTVVLALMAAHAAEPRQVKSLSRI